MKDSYRDFDQLLKEALEEKLEEEIEEIQKDKDLLEKYAPSQELEERMQELFYPKKRKAQALKRVAVFIFLFLGLFSSLMVFNRDVQAQAFSFIEKWLPDRLIMEFTSKDRVEEKNWELGYLPEGYRYKEVIEFPKEKIIIYANRENKELTFYFGSKEAAITTDMDNEDHSIRPIKIGELKGVIGVGKNNNEFNYLLLDSKDYIFSIEGYIPEKELIKIGESIREKNN